MRSPYEVLGLDPDAGEEELKEAYVQRVKESHPDHGGSLEEFQLVRAAYEEIKPGGGSEELGSDSERSDEGYRGETSRIEYLNYEVLDDHGWNLDDDDLFEKASTEDLDPSDYGRFVAQSNESLLEAAENRGFTWPYSCRGGACANCAVAVREGELSMPVSHVLPPEMLDRDIRLSCVGAPTTPEMKVVYNVKHLPDLEDILLPPGPFKHAQD